MRAPTEQGMRVLCGASEMCVTGREPRVGKSSRCLVVGLGVTVWISETGIGSQGGSHGIGGYRVRTQRAGMEVTRWGIQDWKPTGRGG